MLMNSAEYISVLNSVKQEIQQAQYKATLHTNADMLLMYHAIGQIINSHKSWGNKFINNLSADIRMAYPGSKGFSPRNLVYMATFAAAYPGQEFAQQPVAQIPWGHNTVLLDKVEDIQKRIQPN